MHQQSALVAVDTSGVGLPFDSDVTLRPYHTSDHRDHTWASPMSEISETVSGNCHPIIVSKGITISHGSTIPQAGFLGLRNGTDTSGPSRLARAA